MGGGFVQYDDARGVSLEDRELVDSFVRYSQQQSASTRSSSIDESYLNMYGYLMATSRRSNVSGPGSGLLRRFRFRMPFVRRVEPDFYGDQMSYEDILALEEWMGTVPIGVTEQVLKQLKVKTVNGQTDSCCPICLATFTDGDTLRELNCGHDFHQNCVDVWFKEKNNCPVCKADVAAHVHF